MSETKTASLPTIRVSPELLERCRRMSAQTGVTIAFKVREALEQWVAGVLPYVDELEARFQESAKARDDFRVPSYSGQEAVRGPSLAVPPASVPSAFADEEPPQTGRAVMPVSFAGRAPTEADFDGPPDDEEAVTHEQTIVYDADEPVEVEGEFEARPHARSKRK